jgi:type IV pilus assembly protein PilV
MDARGFSLVEVLVAVVLLAVGALGAIGTQAMARRSTTDAVLHARALSLANSLASHIEAEGAGHYLGVDYDGFAGPPPVLAKSCESTGCDAGDLAIDAIHAAAVSLYERFPGGRIVICRDSTIADTDGLAWTCMASAIAPVVIKIGWAAEPHPKLVQPVGAPS